MSSACTRTFRGETSLALPIDVTFSHVDLSMRAVRMSGAVGKGDAAWTAHEPGEGQRWHTEADCCRIAVVACVGQQ
ncbi:hypothetical protein CHLRE_09g396176v5 [Chlamydomonas reinhardtii]|uniref:Uncharacterized protein n=1 Tax=Chlamydomonas reinhardtii TaxID=3055 RepID=A0A2K3DEL1_CHLRE|nr:uncharacterized protein CHLRE_09g396176v5 [Chlamydomonas reinhardtii]PNW78969.1 hypothetical protein CHLRE_09g396176v5 [Chlamydomonas reinhardtii]